MFPRRESLRLLLGPPGNDEVSGSENTSAVADADEDEDEEDKVEGPMFAVDSSM